MGDEVLKMRIPALLLTCCVALDKWLDISELQLSYLEKSEDDGTQIRES